MPSPDAPAAADVVGAAKATAAGNKEAAVAAQFGNMTNQKGAPQYSYKIDPNTGEYTFAPITTTDAKGNVLSSQSGVNYTVPNPSNTTDPQQWTQNTVLGANDQQLFNQSQATQMELSKMGLSGLEAVKKAVAQDVTPDIAVQGGPSNTASGMIKNVRGGFIQGGNLDTTGMQYSPAAAGDIVKNVGLAGDIQSSIGPIGNINTNANANAQALGSYANNANQIQLAPTATERAAALAAEQNTAGKVQTQLGIDPTLLNQNTTDALYKANTQYLDPQFAQSQAKLESQLANQGITRGSEAYNNAMSNFAGQKQQAYESARNQAIGQGTSAAQGLFGMGLQSAQFGNQALGQQFGQNATAQELANAAAGQNTSTAQTNQQLFNAGLGQQYNQNMQAAQFGNQATAQNNAQALANSQYGLSAQQQQYAQQMGLAGLSNEAQQQLYGQISNNATVANAAQQQQYAQNVGNAEFNNAAVNQRFGMAQANQQAKNAAEQQTFANAMQNANLTNQQKQALYEQNLASTQLSNQASNQQLAQNQAIQQNPINILQAVRTGAQLNTANLPAVGVSQPGQLANWQGPDMLGAAMAQNQYNQGIYNAQSAGQAQMISAGIGAAGALGGAGIKAASDRRLKKNIKRIGTHVLGIGLYTWDYLWGEPFSGVMADEVEQVMPEAIVMHPSGFKMVNYSMLGLV